MVDPAARADPESTVILERRLGKNDHVPRRRGPLRNRIEWALVAGFVGLIRRLPPWLGEGLLRASGRLGCRLLPRRRREAVANVERALGLPRREAARVVRQAFEGLACNVGESLLLERALRRRPLGDFVEIEGAEHLEAALQQGRGVVVASAHYGAWECLALVLARRFRPVWAVQRPPDNPHLYKLAVALRGRILAGTIDRDGAGRTMARLVRRGEVLGLLLDQNAGHKGVMMDFLGRPSWHHRVTGTLACRFGAVVLPTYLVREPGVLRYRLVVEPPVLPAAGLEGEQAEWDVVRRVSRSLERRVTERPGQWLWLHDRWWRAEKALTGWREGRRRHLGRVDEGLAVVLGPGLPHGRAGA